MRTFSECREKASLVSSRNGEILNIHITLGSPDGAISQCGAGERVNRVTAAEEIS